MTQLDRQESTDEKWGTLASSGSGDCEVFSLFARTYKAIIARTKRTLLM